MTGWGQILLTMARDRLGSWVWTDVSLGSPVVREASWEFIGEGDSVEEARR